MIPFIQKICTRQIYKEADGWSPRTGGFEGKPKITANGHRVSSWEDEEVLKLTIVMITQH